MRFAFLGFAVAGAAFSVSAGISQPPNCAVQILSAANATPVPIADLATSSSTVVVAGVPPFLFSATLTANILHTFAADLDITLISPAGTRVTLSTDNGAGNDNVFNGTMWSDAATTPTTDAVYVDGVAQPQLIPEEAMSALYGQDPNGTWTLEIADDQAGNVGSLDDWSLTIEALAEPPVETSTVFTNTTPVLIPDVVTTTSTLAVSGLDPYLCRATMTTHITHTFSANLDMTLLAPSRSTTIGTDNGAGNDDVFNGSFWSDTAGTPVTDFVYVNLVTATPLVPEGAFGHFRGIDPNGVWTLSVFNDLAGDTGFINSWSLELTTCACEIPDADVAVTKTVTPEEVAPGGNVVFTLTASNNGPGTANNVVVTDTLPAGMIYVSNDCGAAFASPTLTWNIPSLANGASATCNVTVTVDASGSNGATISSDQNDPVPGNNADAATVGADQNVLEIPTASTYGLLALGLGLGLAAFAMLRRRG